MGLPTQERFTLPPVSGPTLMPPKPLPVMRILSKLNVPPLPTVTKTSPNPVIAPFKLPEALPPMAALLAPMVRFFQLAAAGLKGMLYVEKVGLSLELDTGKAL